MIRKLHQLKSKKGFTLVELIIVIAIIAVLAAILIPTMMGYVRESRITANKSSASSIKNNAQAALVSLTSLGKTLNEGWHFYHRDAGGHAYLTTPVTQTIYFTRAAMADTVGAIAIHVSSNKVIDKVLVNTSAKSAIGASYVAAHHTSNESVGFWSA